MCFLLRLFGLKLPCWVLLSLSRNTSGADGSITVCLIHQTRTRLKYSPSQCLQAVTRYWPVRVVLSELSLDPKCFSNHSPNVVPFFCSYPWRASAHQRNKKVWRLRHGIRFVGQSNTRGCVWLYTSKLENAVVSVTARAILTAACGYSLNRNVNKQYYPICIQSLCCLQINPQFPKGRCLCASLWNVNQLVWCHWYLWWISPQHKTVFVYVSLELFDFFYMDPSVLGWNTIYGVWAILTPTPSPMPVGPGNNVR